MGPSCEMPLRVCVVVVGRSMRSVPVCEYVNVSECVSQCLVFQHNGLLFGIAPHHAPRQPLSQPTTSIQLSNTFSSFLLLVSLVPFKGLLFSHTHFFLCQFMGFTEVFKCSSLYGSCSFVTLCSLFNSNKKKLVVHNSSYVKINK